MTIPAARETIQQAGHFSVTNPGQFQATINTLTLDGTEKIAHRCQVAGWCHPPCSRRNGKRLQGLSLPADLWVVIPAYNEAHSLRGVLLDVCKISPNVVVEDDCSRDETADIADSADVHVCRHPVNLGQGAALATGIEYALRRGAARILTFDADGQHVIEDGIVMNEIMTRTGASVVLGSRFLGNAIAISRARRILLKLAILFTRATTGLDLTDTHNGLRLLDRTAAEKIEIRHNRMAHASEILSQISKLNLFYVEAPSTVRYTNHTRAKGQKWTGAFTILFDLLLGGLYR